MAVWVGGCAYDMDHLVAVVDDGSADFGSGDASGDVGLDARVDTATDTTVTDTGPRPDAMTCASLGTTACLQCCLDAAPKAPTVLADGAGSCLCQDSTCKSACSKEFCKPPGHTIETKACATCVGSVCKDKVDEAKKADPSVGVYLACVAGC